MAFWAAVACLAALSTLAAYTYLRTPVVRWSVSQDRCVSVDGRPCAEVPRLHRRVPVR